MPGELAKRWPTWAQGEPRRAAAVRKLLFYVEQHLGLVRQHIGRRIQDDNVRDLVIDFGTRVNNLVRSVVEAIAVAYSRGVRRKLQGLGEGASQAFAALVDESGIGRLGWSLNQLSWLLGPVFVGPCLVDGRLVLDVVTPARSDVQRIDPETLRSAVWRVRRDWIELDAEGWRYFDEKGEELKYEPHAVGRVPLAIFRCDSYLGFADLGDGADAEGGWWTASEHAGLVDASLEVAYKQAFGLFIRQNGSNKLTVINAALEGIPAGQTIADPMRPLVLFDPNVTNPVQVFDRTVDPSQTLGEIAAIVSAAVQRYGIPPSEITYENSNANWGTLSIAVRGDRLALLRDKQVPWLLRGERQLWPMVADFIRGSTHRLARQMPPGDELVDALQVSFPDLADPKDTKASIEALQAGLALGLDSATDFLMRRRPELTYEEAEAERHANIDDYAKGIEMVASRNIPADDAGRGVQSVAQIQGREGGRISGDIRREGATT